MKEPWKKPCNGKVIITLNNDEKSEEKPTEVEVPVDLNWGNHCERRSSSSSKTLLLAGVILLLGLTLVTLFKVQNLVYSTNYMTWRVQNLEASVGDSADNVKLIKYKLSLDELEDSPQPQALVASKGLAQQQLDAGDLKLSESQNQNHKLNSLATGAKKSAEEPRKPTEDLNDGRDHPNPTDSQDPTKPLTETFDVFRNPPAMEDHFVRDVLKFLTSDLPSHENVEIVELNKMQEPSPEAPRPVSPRFPNGRPPLVIPIDAMFRKASPLSLGSSLKIFQISGSDKPEQQQSHQMQDSLEEEMMPPKDPLLPDAKLRSMISPYEIFKNLMFPGAKVRFFPLGGPRHHEQPASSEETGPNEDQEGGEPEGRDSEATDSEEDNPKIMIQSIKLRVQPLMHQEEPPSARMEAPAGRNNNFEIIRLNPVEQQSRDQQPMQPQQILGPLFPIQEILNSVIKHVEENEAGQQQQQPPRFGQPMTKMLVPPADQAPDNYYAQAAAQEQHHDVEVSKVPVHQMGLPLPSYHQMINLAMPVPLMDSYREPIVEDMPQQQQQQQQQPQQEVPQQQLPQQAQPVQPQPQQQPEEPRAMPRSTKLNPVESTWNLPTQYPTSQLN
ncbi:histone-lysine N-methyltransferase 2D-like [Copidosoma floridanum]|uniref:histone-lysine N-methyltransferase 2D-like n=1 Tax=Copidosoma floridanum TaxID=29053 RepID=UPI0006C9C19E|nr:histone-lysine N-methyltransferase 2D-like [Copidosoma floridanum]